MTTKVLRAISALVVFFFLLPCAGKALSGEHEEARVEGRVYVMANEAGGNAILVFQRSGDGVLTLVDKVSTGGLGSGPGPLPGSSAPGPIPLNSQDSLIATEDGRFLIAGNAGSNDISVFAVRENGLELTDRASSGGIFPISLAHHAGLIYVLNAGGPKSFVPNPLRPAPTLSGFFLDEHGKLSPIPGSTHEVGTSTSVPADVLFTANGKLMIVTEVQVNSISVFHVSDDGRIDEPQSFASLGANPFGAAVGRHHLLAVAEGHEVAQNGMGIPHGATVSTYQVTEDGDLEPLSREVPSLQTAGLWLRFTSDGRHLYTSNIGSAALSAFSVSPRGEISLLGDSVATGQPGMSLPIDLAITPNDRFLYVAAIDFFHGAVTGFHIEEDGSLTFISTIGGFPISMEGIVAR